MAIVLGIETSCDETAAAVVADGRQVRSNIISSQVALHRPYGGVVPELASRNHLEMIDRVITQALAEAATRLDAVDAVAATYGPGLASSLLIGLNAAKGIALATCKPFLPINHLEAHLYSPLLAADDRHMFPMVSLIVSGGHTILVHVTRIGAHRILGQTLDDAAGEAFDKVAKLLKLGYPGGPEIDALAQHGDPAVINFPRSMLDDPGFDFSFSGLKTAVLYFLQRDTVARTADICAGFQEAVVDVLIGKLIRAALVHRVGTISASGGVSLNSRFRARLTSECAARGWRLLLAPSSVCTDNAAMIAALGHHQLIDSTWSPSAFSVDVAPSCGLAVPA